MAYTVLFKTVHGSRLYGLSHDESDYDYYTVVDKVKTKKAKYATQDIVDDVDSVVVDFGTWMGMCVKGVPQALEAMFSQEAEIDKIATLRAGFRAGAQARDTYARTIKSFAMQDDYKPKRHALRLAFNLASLGRYGRFNPRLKDWQVEIVNELAKLPSQNVYDDALLIAYR